MHPSNERGIPLHTKILLGMVFGILVGLLFNLNRDRLELLLGFDLLPPLLRYVLEPVGKIFLNLLLMTVVPLVFASIASAVAQLGDLAKLGRMGLKTLGYFIVTMSLAVTIGLTLVNLLQPGAGLPDETREKLVSTYGQEASQRAGKPVEFGIQTFVNIVTSNPLRSAVEMDMLGVIFFALLIGAGLTVIPSERSGPLTEALVGITELMVFIIGLAMRLAPYGVFAFLFRATASFGFDLLMPLGLYVLVVLTGLAIQMFVSFPILIRLFSRISPLEFFRRIRVIILTAFSTSSSSGTLPTSIKVTEEELRVPPQVAGFVLPLGATMNMNGTALFEGVTVVFLAQVYGVSLDLGQQMIVVLMSVLTAIGAAGVPGGSLPLIIMVMAAVNVPPEGIAIILGVDRLLDMCRTTLNVVGDVTCATFIARSEGFPLLDEAVPTEPIHDEL